MMEVDDVGTPFLAPGCPRRDIAVPGVPPSTGPRYHQGMHPEFVADPPNGLWRRGGVHNGDLMSEVRERTSKGFHVQPCAAHLFSRPAMHDVSYPHADSESVVR